MPLSMLVWFLVGFSAWLVIAIWFGEVRVGDLFIAAMVSVTGPMLPLLVWAWYVGIWLEKLAKIVIWKKRKVKPLGATQA